jgi:hypothetical protein
MAADFTPLECNPMYITRHDDFSDLEADRRTWNEMARGIPFRTYEWLSAWWRHYGSGASGVALADRDLYLLTAWNERDELVAVAPWYRQITRSGAQIVRCLGDGEVCSEYHSVLCRPGDERLVAATLAEWMTAANQAPQGSRGDAWDRLELTPVDASDFAIAELLCHFERCGNRVHRDVADPCWRIELPATWDEYLDQQSKQQRRRLRQADRNWLQSGLVNVKFAPDERDADEAFAIFVDLHQRRWQGRGMPGCFSSRQFLDFHRDVWQQLAPEGRIEICLLEHLGKPIAADYILLGDDSSYGYQSGIDPNLLDMQPGHLLNQVGLRQAIMERKRYFDLLRGDEPYKARLGAKPHPMMSARVVPPFAAARLRYAAWNAGRQVRGLAKRGWKAARQWQAGRLAEARSPSAKPDQ